MQKLFKMLVLVVAAVAMALGTGCSFKDFHAPRYGTPITAGGGVGYSSTVIQTLQVVNRSKFEVEVSFPQFTPMTIPRLTTAYKDLRVTERMDVAYSITYKKNGEPVKVLDGYVCLEPIFNPYSGGGGYRNPTPQIRIPEISEDDLR